jgi:hypothetical protein
MTSDVSGARDSISVDLNGDDAGPAEGTSGPDPTVWDNPEHQDTGFEPADGDGPVKGPDPTVWGEDARAERGADVTQPEQPAEESADDE